MILRPLTRADEAQARAAHAELAADDFEFLLQTTPGESWGEYVASLDRVSRGDVVGTPWVPASFLVADADGQIVGRSSIRHELNDWLAQWGGHIGYGVRPGFRRRGYATEILRQSLAYAAGMGIERALLTCDDDNLASAATIERCGGVLETITPGPEGVGKTRRYWIDTAPYVPAAR